LGAISSSNVTDVFTSTYFRSSAFFCLRTISPEHLACKATACEIDQNRQDKRDEKAVTQVAHHPFDVFSRSMPHFLGRLRLIGRHRFRLVTGVISGLRAAPRRRDFRLDLFHRRFDNRWRRRGFRFDFLLYWFDSRGRRRQRHGVTLMLDRADGRHPIRLAWLAEVRRHDLAATVVAAVGDKYFDVILRDARLFVHDGRRAAQEVGVTLTTPSRRLICFSTPAPSKMDIIPSI
jgi:hypothetical protein